MYNVGDKIKLIEEFRDLPIGTKGVVSTVRSFPETDRWEYEVCFETGVFHNCTLEQITTQIDRDDEAGQIMYCAQAELESILAKLWTEESLDDDKNITHRPCWYILKALSSIQKTTHEDFSPDTKFVIEQMTEYLHPEDYGFSSIFDTDYEPPE